MQMDPIVLFCRQRGFPVPEREFKFHPVRKWRADYLWPSEKIALEKEGGVWTGGRHIRPSGFVKDLEKYNMLALMGYRLVRFTPKMLTDGSVFPILEELFHDQGRSLS